MEFPWCPTASMSSTSTRNGVAIWQLQGKVAETWKATASVYDDRMEDVYNESLGFDPFVYRLPQQNHVQ